jgi:hypothetical protein
MTELKTHANAANRRETVALIDFLKERHGLRNRGQLVMELIEERRQTTQQQ